MHKELQILLVDDDAADRLRVKRALQDQSRQADIWETATCAEALGAIAAQRFDCIFLDYHVPDGDGLGCLVTLRASGSAAPIVILTNDGDEKLAVESIKAGATDYLRKEDMTPNLLDHCLRGAIRYQQAQGQVQRTYEALQLRDRAIAAASNGIVICDPHQTDCPIIYCNPAFSAITGYPPEEVLGRNCRFLQGPDTDADYVQQVRDALRQERECLIILKNYKKDGALFWNELSVSPVRDPQGRVTHFIGVQTDITERKTAEEALRLNVARQHALLRDMFSSVTEGRLTLCAAPEEFPVPLEPVGAPIPLSATGGIRELRQRTMTASLTAGLSDIRRYDLETAVGEAAMNAVVHASTGIGQVFAGSHGTVQVRVEDAGKGIAVQDLPNATLKRGYSSAGTMGHGFKMILKTADRVYLQTGSTGTIVVIEQDQIATLTDW